MARDKSSKASSRAKAPAPPSTRGDRPGHDAGNPQNPSKSRRGFFGLLRGDKSKSKKITLVTAEPPTSTTNTDADDDRDTTSSSVGPNNNNTITRSASFSEVGEADAKQEQSTRKVKRHLSVSRSGKMKEVRKRTSLAELAQRFETQAKV